MHIRVQLCIQSSTERVLVVRKRRRKLRGAEVELSSLFICSYIIVADSLREPKENGGALERSEHARATDEAGEAPLTESQDETNSPAGFDGANFT